MQTESSQAPNRNSVMLDERPYAHGLAVETSSDESGDWMENSFEQPLYHHRWLHGALSVDPIRILIVAELGTSIQIAALVHSIGQFETRIACSPDPALSIARQFLPNIVLMSTDLPDFASYHLASALRWRYRSPSLRLIALTDDIPGTDRRRALAAGFEQYLTLPVQQAALESALTPRLESPPRKRDLRRPQGDRAGFHRRENL
jgi:CheY-like chemotaxis protein